MGTIVDDTRAAWGAAPNTNPRPIAPGARIGISWHYDGGAALGLASKSHGACLARVKADQQFHQKSRGWADVGYNLLVCQHGRVIEGRGADLQGAHSTGVNVEHYGVQFMVGGNEPPTAAAYARAATLARQLATHSGRNLRMWKHSDDPKVATLCCGPVVGAWVRRQGVARPNTATSTPVPTPAPAPAPAPAPVTPEVPDMQITDIVPGTNPPITWKDVAVQSIRGNEAYERVIENGWIDRRLDAVESSVKTLRTAIETDDKAAAQAILDRIDVILTVKPDAPVAP